jgi:hypothetical protein
MKPVSISNGILMSRMVLLPRRASPVRVLTSPSHPSPLSKWRTLMIVGMSMSVSDSNAHVASRSQSPAYTLRTIAKPFPWEPNALFMKSTEKTPQDGIVLVPLQTTHAHVHVPLCPTFPCQDRNHFLDFPPHGGHSHTRRVSEKPEPYPHSMTTVLSRPQGA